MVIEFTNEFLGRMTPDQVKCTVGHELGHFLAARRRGVKVTRFSIGFGPAIWKRTAKDGVEYRLLMEFRDVAA